MEYVTPPPTDRGCILLAEDEPHIRRILQTVLEGSRIRRGRGGREGTVARDRMIGNQS